MELREIKGFEDYLVSDSGDNNMTIWSKRRQKWLKGYKGVNGYYYVNLCKDNKLCHKYLHRLIAEAFIPNPENKPCIDHISTVRTDNRKINLRWVDRKGNMNNPLTRAKMSESAKGKIINDATRAKLSAANKGQNHPFFGRHHSEESKAKMSAARKGKYCGENHHLFGKHRSAEAKAKMSAARKGKCMGKDHHNSIPIVQLTKDGEFIKQWDCTSEAARELGINNISTCCMGRQKSAGGFKWMHLSDYQKKENTN